MVGTSPMVKSRRRAAAMAARVSAMVVVICIWLGLFADRTGARRSALALASLSIGNVAWCDLLDVTVFILGFRIRARRGCGSEKSGRSGCGNKTGVRHSVLHA